MHHKFLVIDQTTVITGSANLTSSGLHGDAGRTSSRGNVNHLLRFYSPELALVFRNEFTEMWGMAPMASRTVALACRKQAEAYKPCRWATLRGVEIRLVADPGFASHPFSEVLDLLGVTLPDHTCKVEAGNQPLNQALQGVGTPRLARGD